MERLRHSAWVLLGSLCLSATAALAQAPRSDDVRGSAPPGSVDGERPGDGAIKGGILPGEVGGTPENGRGPTTPQAHPGSRCADLTGTLKEQCLLEAQGAATGTSRKPDSDSRDAGPRTEPPPQSPRGN
ncbi:MAG: hypothetical protein JO035_09045 [Betaproteobacteria bacterium]|nr:hypothetical protein [Betaproteobacteria bacterium]